ncbi:MAG: SDR family oxidoreductase [Rhodobacteraceae bacterium]|nr:SDR family oxidoreductase [Paracoccaceae bacterium]
MERFGLSGKVAVVTGGARGIGRAVAELAASTGAEIAIVDILEDVAKQTAKEISETSGRRVVAYGGDLSKAANSPRIVDAIIADFGRIDVLFNGIGINPNTPALEIQPEEWEAVMNVNINGQFYISQAVARKMVERGSGTIVAIGSNSGFTVDRPQPQAHYNTSKAAVHQMVKSLAMELAPHGIRVNAVAPGYVITDLTARGISNPDWLPMWKSMTPLGRFGQPEEIANLMLFLASDASSYMTGAIVLIDGGYTCW